MLRLGGTVGFDDRLAPSNGGRMAVEVYVMDGGLLATAPVTVSASPVRNNNNNPALPALESEAELLLEWSSPKEGGNHQALLDIGRGVVVTVAAHYVRAQIRNVGAGQAEPPAASWKVNAALGPTSRVTPAFRSLIVPLLARDIESATLFVPAWARRLSVPRAPQNGARVRFFRGNAALLAEFDISALSHPTFDVPVGADRVSLINLDAADLNARLQFELAL